MRKLTICLTAMLAVAFLLYVAQAEPNGLGRRQAGSLPAKGAAPQADETAELPTVGLLVHVGCGTGEETLQLAKSGSFVVHALEEELPKVRQARSLIKAAGLYGQIAVEHCTSRHLPYADNLVNLLVASKADAPPQQEILRVLRPGGVARIGQEIIRKPWPKTLDGWTHVRHGPDGNPVSQDLAVSLPGNIRWVASASQMRFPLLIANGRNFDHGPVVRDAFNGLPLWNKKGMACWAATDNVLYGISGNSVVGLDAATGTRVGQFGPADRETCILWIDNTLIVTAHSGLRAYTGGTEQPRWTYQADSPGSRVTSNRTTVVAGDGRVFFVAGNPKRGEPCVVVCLDLASGEQLWRSSAYPWLAKVSGCSYSHGLLAYEESSFKDEAGDTGLHLMLARDGSHLWTHRYTPGMTHAKQARAFFVGKDLWVHSQMGFTQLDLSTGRPIRSVPGGRGHCYPAVATARFLVGGELNFTHIATGKSIRNAITKGQCGRNSWSSGWIPGHGLLYTYKGGGCICFPMVKAYLGLAPDAANPSRAAPSSAGSAFVKGPGKVTSSKTPSPQANAEWPCYRHDAWRSGSTASPVAEKLQPLWTTQTDTPGQSPFASEWKGNPFVNGPVTPPVIAGGTVFVGLPDLHEVVAMDAENGKVRWTYVANGRVDTPPTYYNGLCLFGTRSGWVYCLSADKGELVWRCRVGPQDRRITAWGQLESAWPVPGSVLVYQGAVLAAGGRSALADGGLHVCAIKATTGRGIWRTTVTDYDLRHWYGRLGWDYEPTDLMVLDGETPALSRARIGARGGRASVKVNRDAGAFYRNNAGAYVPMGLWSYAKANSRSYAKRPLYVFRDRVLYGPVPSMQNGKLGSDSSGIHACILATTPPKTDGHEWTPYLHLASLTKNWSAKVGKSQAMVQAGERLFVANQQGMIRVLSVKDGSQLGEHRLDGKPVWDSMAAAYGRLYVSLAEGGVACLGDPSSGTKVSPSP